MNNELYHASGWTKKNHKYLRIENGRYIYPDQIPSSDKKALQKQMVSDRNKGSNYMPSRDQFKQKVQNDTKEWNRLHNIRRSGIQKAMDAKAYKQNEDRYKDFKNTRNWYDEDSARIFNYYDYGGYATKQMEQRYNKERDHKRRMKNRKLVEQTAAQKRYIDKIHRNFNEKQSNRQHYETEREKAYPGGSHAAVTNPAITDKAKAKVKRTVTKGKKAINRLLKKVKS